MWAFLFHGNITGNNLDLPGYQYFHQDFLGIPRKVIRRKLGSNPNSREVPADILNHLLDISKRNSFLRNLKIVEPNGLHLVIAQSRDVMAIVAALAIGQRNAFTLDGSIERTSHTADLILASTDDTDAFSKLQRMEKVSQVRVFRGLP
jgi:hypothetical protein